MPQLQINERPRDQYAGAGLRQGPATGGLQAVPTAMGAGEAAAQTMFGKLTVGRKIHLDTCLIINTGQLET